VRVRRRNSDRTRRFGQRQVTNRTEHRLRAETRGMAPQEQHHAFGQAGQRSTHLRAGVLLPRRLLFALLLVVLWGTKLCQWQADVSKAERRLRMRGNKPAACKKSTTDQKQQLNTVAEDAIRTHEKQEHQEPHPDSSKEQAKHSTDLEALHSAHAPLQQFGLGRPAATRSGQRE
jgi:hypothetical protein